MPQVVFYKKKAFFRTQTRVLWRNALKMKWPSVLLTLLGSNESFIGFHAFFARRTCRLLAFVCAITRLKGDLQRFTIQHGNEGFNECALGAVSSEFVDSTKNEKWENSFYFPLLFLTGFIIGKQSQRSFYGLYLHWIMCQRFKWLANHWSNKVATKSQLRSSYFAALLWRGK